MTNEEILTVFSGILRALLGDDDIELTMETVRDDVDNWDSFTYVNFMVIAEEELGVKFDAADIEAFGSVGEIVDKTRLLLA